MLENNGVDLQLVLLDLRQDVFTGRREQRCRVVLVRCGEIRCGSVQLLMINRFSGSLSRSGGNIVCEAAVCVDGSLRRNRITHRRTIKGLVLRQCRGGGDPEKTHLLRVVRRTNVPALIRIAHQLSAELIKQKPISMKIDRNNKKKKKG